MTYEDVHVAGWDVGTSVPVNRTTVIDGGHFEAIRAIDVRRAHDTLRTVDITGDPTFVTLTDSQLRGREQFDIYLNGDISLKNRDLDTYFSPDIVRLGTVRFNNHQVYYHQFRQPASWHSPRMGHPSGFRRNSSAKQTPNSGSSTASHRRE